MKKITRSKIILISTLFLIAPVVLVTSCQAETTPKKHDILDVKIKNTNEKIYLADITNSNQISLETTQKLFDNLNKSNFQNLIVSLDNQNINPGSKNRLILTSNPDYIFTNQTNKMISNEFVILPNPTPIKTLVGISPKQIVEPILESDILGLSLQSLQKLFNGLETENFKHINSQVVNSGNNKHKVILKTKTGYEFEGSISSISSNEFTITKPSNDLLEFEKGGSLPIDNFIILNVDKYLSIAQQLSFQEYTKISNLTDKILNDNLKKNNKFAQLSVKILEGSSDKTGILRLSLNGIYQGKQIDNKIINISKFLNINDGLEIRFTNLIKINKNTFIEDLKNNSNIAKLSIQEFLKYNETPLKIRIQFEMKSIELDFSKLVNNNFLDNFVISNGNINNELWNIKANISQKEFKNNNWINLENIPTSISNYKVSFDVLKSALDVLTEKATVQNNLQSNIYGSTVFINSKKGNAVFDHYFVLDQKISNFYFPNNGNNGESYVSIEVSRLSPNDVTGILSGSFKAIIAGANISNTYEKEFQISNFKSTKTLFTPNNLDKSSNIITVRSDKSFANSIIKDMNKTGNKKDILNLKEGEKISQKLIKYPLSFNRPNFLSSGSLLFNNEYNSSGNPNDETNFSYLKNLQDSGLSIYLLRQSKTVLEIISNREGFFNNFFIKAISVLDNQSDGSIEIKKTGAFYNISYNLKLQIDYFESVQEITVQSADILIDVNSIV